MPLRLSPLSVDESTMALSHFDGLPAPPLFGLTFLTDFMSSVGVSSSMGSAGTSERLAHIEISG